MYRTQRLLSVLCLTLKTTAHVGKFFKCYFVVISALHIFKSLDYITNQKVNQQFSSLSERNVFGSLEYIEHACGSLVLQGIWNFPFISNK